MKLDVTGFDLIFTLLLAVELLKSEGGVGLGLNTLVGGLWRDRGRKTHLCFGVELGKKIKRSGVILPTRITAVRSNEWVRGG